MSVLLKLSSVIKFLTCYVCSNIVTYTQDCILQHELEKDNILSELLTLQKEVSTLSSSSLMKEKESIRKELDKAKTKLRETENKLKNYVQEKIKLEVIILYLVIWFFVRLVWIQVYLLQNRASINPYSLSPGWKSRGPQRNKEVTKSEDSSWTWFKETRFSHCW